MIFIQTTPTPHFPPSRPLRFDRRYEHGKTRVDILLSTNSKGKNLHSAIQSRRDVDVIRIDVVPDDLPKPKFIKDNRQKNELTILFENFLSMVTRIECNLRKKKNKKIQLKRRFFKFFFLT